MKPVSVIPEEVRERILKEARKRHRDMIVTQIFETKDKYVVEYVKTLGGKEYSASFHKDVVEN